MSSFRQYSKTLTATGITIVIVMVLYAAGWLRPIEHWLGVTVQPIFNVFYAVLDTVSPLYSTTDSTLLAENTALKDLLTKTVRENHELQTQLIQYQEYKEQLAFAREKDYTIIPAKIISRVGQTDISQVIVINRGSSHGLAEGYPVMYGAGILLGTVTTVHDSYSEVTLVTNEASQIQATIQSNAATTTGVVRGQFGTSLLLEYILKDQPITNGDIIITNGQDRFIPSGLVIGTVQGINDSSSELFKSATLTPLIRYGNNAIVSVVLPKL